MTAMFAISSWGTSTRFREQIMAQSAFPLKGDIAAFLVLNQLVYRGVARPTEIADAIDTGRSNVSKVVSRLETHGLILRIADPHDRRGVALALTTEGRAVGQRIMHATRLLQTLPDSWTDEDGQELERLVVKLARALNALPQHPLAVTSATADQIIRTQLESTLRD
ncbi:MarR family winged helix-turn-helix transcriptional regulator [Rathayibacter festucae]|jgi:DNA-binding MarR family transcriptional regulator|uniref:MarR family winged helix-turn-helix transcriptional regulator n=1 Tax=Rathayibacter festucae TaxID=110937 RepID=UPI002A6B2EF3|nr:MarR family transcriptional regulator [Rathayibacter festucae]MDY0914549.1 MarR family transcriptional regulator [Rathayibacter festucae]